VVASVTTDVDLPKDPAVPVIAADAGLAAVLASGRSPSVVVGDFDSVDPDDLVRAERLGARIERHPTAKDQTDLELAVDEALAFEPERIVVASHLGGRADHALAGALLLASPKYARVPVIEGRLGTAVVVVVHGGSEIELVGEPGALVSLIPVHGRARGVRTEGLRFPLSAESLEAGSTRGVSNEMLGRSATVALDEGTLLVVQPGADTDEGRKVVPRQDLR